MLNEKVKQPLERRYKQILVSIYEGYRLVGWRLVTAKKVGNKYIVLSNARCRK